MTKHRREHDPAEINHETARRVADDVNKQLMEDGLPAAEWLTAELQRFDETFEPQMPSLEQFAALVAGTKREAKRKLWRDLAVFWLVGCIVLSGMALAWTNDVIWILVIQVAGTVGGLAFIGSKFVGRTSKGLKGKWTN